MTKLDTETLFWVRGKDVSGRLVSLRGRSTLQMHSYLTYCTPLWPILPLPINVGHATPPPSNPPSPFTGDTPQTHLSFS